MIRSKWIAGKYNIGSLLLGNGINANVSWSTRRDDPLPNVARLFSGEEMQFRNESEAKEWAEKRLAEIFREALAKLGMPS